MHEHNRLLRFRDALEDIFASVWIARWAGMTLVAVMRCSWGSLLVERLDVDGSWLGNVYDVPVPRDCSDIQSTNPKPRGSRKEAQIPRGIAGTAIVALTSHGGVEEKVCRCSFDPAFKEAMTCTASSSFQNMSPNLTKQTWGDTP